MKWGWVLAAALAACSAGCSAVVDPDDGPLLCAVAAGEPDPCPRGLACIRGECRSPSTGMDGGACTEMGEERCNGLDDDCDGVVDEGQDLDDDGFTWCGGGVMTLADCDDSDPTIHPADPDRGIAAGVESCDGSDNDCDGSIDESDASPICPAGKSCIDRACVDPDDCTLLGNECDPGDRCDVTLDPPSCVAGGCTPDSCPVGQVCDERTRSCVTRQPLGSPCATDAECESGHCAPKEALRLGTAAERICVSPCCSDADCGSADVCWTAGTGARLCVPAEMVDRQRGPGSAGDGCADGSQCQSGLCFTDPGVCLANCSAESHCASGQTCTLWGPFDTPAVSSQYQIICVEPAGSGGIGSGCWYDSDCRSETCIGETALTPGLCSGACSTTADCGSDMYCTFLAAGDPARFVQMCWPRIPFGGHPDGTTGSSCSGNDDCRDDACVRSTCADTCCSDSQCPAGTRCRAVRFGDARYEMHCVP